MRLNGKVAIVTGAATGLGRAIALRYAQEGAAVAIVDLAGYAQTAQDIMAAGGRAVGIGADVSSEAQTLAAVSSCIDAFGRVDVLVNNAAMSACLKPEPFETIDIDQWRQVMDVNVLGPFLCVRAVAPHMRAQRGGSIINLGSVTVMKGLPMMTHYVASKAAVHTMTRTLARELGDDHITVNAIAPGYVLTQGQLANTEMLSRQREAVARGRCIPRDSYPEDLTGAAVFLASDEARFVTGQILAVDGGSV